MKMNRRFAESISTEEIKVLEHKFFEREIILVDNLLTYRRVLDRLKRSQILGFDTETKPSFRKGRKNKVSLLQLADEKLACLFRINKIGLPDELQKILSDESIIKIGVAIHDDLRVLNQVKKFNPHGFIDLQNFVKQYGIQSASLRKLAAIVLGCRISKSQQVTDWEAQTLSPAQQVYAATDAWICQRIYRELLNGELNSTIDG
jgi:ribonuclease D